MISDPLTLEGAIAAGARGELHQWLQAFLRSPGGLNESLADHFEQARPQYEPPAPISLVRMTRIAGPEPSIPWFIDADTWEGDVAAKAASIEAGWEPPPLIAHRESLALSDGNRRYEALRRRGTPAYWTILFY